MGGSDFGGGLHCELRVRDGPDQARGHRRLALGSRPRTHAAPGRGPAWTLVTSDSILMSSLPYALYSCCVRPGSCLSTVICVRGERRAEEARTHYMPDSGV